MTTTTRRTSTAEGIAGVVAAVAAWGFGPIFVKLIDLPGLTLALYRLWLGFVVMLLSMVVMRRRITAAELRVAGGAGLLFGVNVAFFFTALKHTSVADASLITALAPVLILVVAGPLFGERIHFRDLVLTATVIGGVVLVVLGSSGSPSGARSAICWPSARSSLGPHTSSSASGRVCTSGPCSTRQG